MATCTQPAEDTAFSFTPSALRGRVASGDGRGLRCPASLLPTPARQPGVLPSNQATLHLLSGIMSTPLNWLLLAQANFYSLDYPFSFPLFSANGLTMCLPVTSPPLLASREESLNLSSLKGWACAGRNVGCCWGQGSLLLTSTASWPQMLHYFMGCTHSSQADTWLCSVSFRSPPQSSAWLSLCL